MGAAFIEYVETESENRKPVITIEEYEILIYE